MTCEQRVVGGTEGSVPKDFADAQKARFRFADLGELESRASLGGKHPREVSESERQVLYPARETAIAEAIGTETTSLAKAERLVAVVGATHLPGIKKLLESVADVEERDTLPLGWHHVDFSDPEE